MSEATVGARRAMTVAGGVLFGFAATAARTMLWNASCEGGYTLGGLGAGHMVAAPVRNSAVGRC